MVDFVQPDKRIIGDLLIFSRFNLLVLQADLSSTDSEVWMLLLRLDEVFEAHLGRDLQFADSSLRISLIHT